MLPVTNEAAFKAIVGLESLLPIISRQNSQYGTRDNFDFGTSSLIKFNEEEYTLEGIYYSSQSSHIHYRIHLSFTKPMIEMLAADPSKDPYARVENELQQLLKAARIKHRREERKRQAKELGLELKTGGPGANCFGIYVWSGDGDEPASKIAFKALLKKNLASEYYVKVAIKLGFYAIKYRDKVTASRKELF